MILHPIAKGGSYVIPNSVTSIEEAAFYYCTELTSISIPNSVTIIGREAFRNCKKLTSVSLPKSIVSIADNAFWYCSGLVDFFSYNPVPPTCGTSVFYQCPTSTCTLHVPSGAKNAYAEAPGWKSFKNIVDGARDPETEGGSEGDNTNCDCSLLQTTVDALQTMIVFQQAAINTLTKRVEALENHTCGDMNGDNKVTVVDVSLIVDKALKQ